MPETIQALDIPPPLLLAESLREKPRFNLVEDIVESGDLKSGDDGSADYLGIEKETTPSTVKSVLRAVGATYFDSKSIESEKLYETLGIRFFKKYLPTTGDLAMKHLWNRSGKRGLIPKSMPLNDQLRMFELTTRFFETVHLGMFGVMGCFDIENGEYSSTPQNAAKAAGTQLIINIYPIMLQRYNRIRVTNLIKRRNAIPY